MGRRPRRNYRPWAGLAVGLCLTGTGLISGAEVWANEPVAPAATPAPPPPGSTGPAAGPDTDKDDAEREVLVIMKTGQRIQGILAEANDKNIVVKVSGINATFAIADIERYEFLPPLMERYRELRAAVGNDPDQIVDLAGWLRDRGKYELALAEVDRALEVSPEHSECLRLKLELEQQILLRSRAKPGEKPQPAGNPGDIPGGGEKPDPRRARIHDFPLLTAAQVDLIKVYEVDLAEKPRVLIPREAMERLMQDFSGHPLIPVTKEGRDALLRRNPVEHLDLIFRLQARDLYSQVQVLDMPGSIRKFRENVHATWLLNSCATTMCHGGNDAGRLVLATRRPNHDQTVYTNYYILQKFRTRDGLPLIDWENPEKSVLFQMALPREDSLSPHPPAPVGEAGRDGWKRAFRDTGDRLFEKSVEWVRSAYRPRPEYTLPYSPAKPFEPPPAQAGVPKTPAAGGAGGQGGGGGGGGEPQPR